MKPSWKHSQYYTFTQSFPTAGLICVASIPAPSERLDGFFLCSSMHRNEEQGGFWAPQISLPRQSPAVDACRGAGTGETQRVLGLSPSAKHLHPLTPYRAGMEVSELPKWSSCSGREGEEFSCLALSDFMEELRVFFTVFSPYCEAPLKTAYLCCLYGVLPAAKYTQVCTPNSCQTSVSPFAPCCHMNCPH